MGVGVILGRAGARVAGMEILPSLRPYYMHCHRTVCSRQDQHSKRFHAQSQASSSSS